MPAVLIGYAALACFGGGLFVVAFILGRNPVAERPEYGARGLKRSAAMEEGLFKTIEPVMRLVAGWMDGVPMPQMRERVRKELSYSGDWLGLDSNEFIALSVISAVGLLLFGFGCVWLLDFPVVSALFFSLFGLAMPYMNVQGASKERFKQINRTLPAAIDLAALCMGAGLDFPGALKQIVEKSSSKSAMLVEEISRILQELDLGHTRRKALEGFAERCPTEAVKDFVGTVVQAEAKGTPLAEVLSIQARMLRMRRSVAAEEAAAKAGLMMMGPLMLMFFTIIILLMGPFAVRFLTSGF